MPTVLRKDGFEVQIYFNDHPPAHVHVFKGGGEAKINLDPVTVVQVWNLNRQEARKAKRLVTENRQSLLKHWEKINGP
jgi:hypothetical protein